MRDDGAQRADNAAGLPDGARDALGLTPLEGVVLGLVLSDQEITLGRVMEVTGRSDTSVGRAAANLERQGLVARVPGRRPTVLFLGASAEAALAAMVERATTEQGEVQRALRDLGQQVAEGLVRAQERGRPFFERDPRPRGLTELPRPPRRGRTQHDEVVALSSLGGQEGPRSGTQCRARVLVAGASPIADLRGVARAQSRGSQVRWTRESLPEVRVLDGERVGLRASTRDGWQLVWSNDAAHVRAVSEVFALWWDRAQPVDP